MLGDLYEHLDSDKAGELTSRLDHSDTKTALAAEAELGLLWAISRAAHLEVEPKLASSSKRPDACSRDLFWSSAVIEIRALSDDSFSGKEMMDRTANIIAGYGDQLRKGAGRHLYFQFQERSYWDRRFHRERCVDPNFQLTPGIRSVLRAWITADNWPTPDRIRIAEGRTDVVISWHEITVPQFRVASSMPPVAYGLEDNPIYKALKKKSAQVKGASKDTIRCVFLVDAGCGLLRNLRPIGAVHEVGGDAIIQHALRKLKLDLLCVFSPYRQREMAFTAESRLFWKVSVFDRRDSPPDHEFEKLRHLAGRLPRPRFEGYQARDLHRQGAFDPTKRGWYLPTCTTTRLDGKMTVKISSRLLLEYLSGRLDAESFRREAFGSNDKNYFDLQLTRGHTIQAASFEEAGVDEDDDYVAFDLDFDWSAAGEKLKPPTKKSKFGRVMSSIRSYFR